MTLNADSRTDWYKALKEIHTLESISSLLNWDQQVYLPNFGADFRASQIEYLAILRHKLITDLTFEKKLGYLYSKN